MDPDSLVQFLTWDSEFFGMRIANINANRISKEEKNAIDVWCLDNRIDCLCFLADPSDTATISVAEESEFHLVDIRVTLDRKISAMAAVWQSEAPPIRLAAAADGSDCSARGGSSTNRPLGLQRWLFAAVVLPRS